MKHIILAAALLGLSGCGALFGPPATLEETLEDAAGFFNRRGMVSLPSEFGEARIEAKVEGKDTIIVRIVDAPTGYDTLDPNIARKLLRGKLCDISRVRGIFTRGGRIRVEIISNIGVEATSFQLASC
jgi:hypothetical protein